jgi:superfamily II DNA or RNA helicase
MSRKFSINILSDEEKNIINDELTIKIEPDSYSFMTQPKYIIPYDIDNDNFIYIPFAYGEKYERPLRSSFPIINYNFTGNLRLKQKKVVNESIKYLNKSGNVILSLYTGFGKSISAIYLAHKIKLKTIILLHRVVLINQWESTIKRFCLEAKIQKLTTKSKKKDCDLYLINAQNVGKLGKDFFNDIGTIIVDELHLIMAESLSNSLQHLVPRYLIGLSPIKY